MKSIQESSLFASEWIANRKSKVASWLDEQSEFYTMIMEEPVKRRTVILVNLVAVCILTAAIMAEGALIISFIATFCAGYLVKRLNTKDDKK